MRIYHTQTAKNDLEDIFEYIAQDSPKRAIDFIRKLKEAIEDLTVFPQMGVDCKKKNIDLDCQILIYRSYLIFYGINKDAVVIYRILHASVDYKKSMKGKK